MFVVYSSADEAIVTTKDQEQRMLAELFADKADRNLEGYDREEVKDCAVHVTANISIG